MTCDHAQDLILTDYLDNEISVTLKTDLEHHLRECPRCQEFLFVSINVFVKPFKEAAREKAPDDIWHSLKERIEQESEKSLTRSISQFLRSFKSMVLLPKPSWAFVSILSSVFVAVILIRLVIIKGKQETASVMASQPKALSMAVEQTSFIDQEDHEARHLVSLMEVSTVSDDNGSSGYGTEIEEYFL